MVNVNLLKDMETLPRLVDLVSVELLKYLLTPTNLHLFFVLSFHGAICVLIATILSKLLSILNIHLPFSEVDKISLKTRENII